MDAETRRELDLMETRVDRAVKRAKKAEKLASEAVGRAEKYETAMIQVEDAVDERMSELMSLIADFIDRFHILESWCEEQGFTNIQKIGYYRLTYPSEWKGVKR